MKIKYIKLGIGGGWEKTCLLEQQTVRLGYESPHHQASLNGQWDEVFNYWLQARNGHSGAASRDVNQIREFYELDETDIWITFYKRKLYWCHAYKDVEELSDGSRIRRVIGSWSSTSKNGKTLSIDNLDGRITKVQAFRGTICGVELPDYLMRKINDQVQPEVLATQRALDSLQNNIEELIKGLWWGDFELLIDLIFSKSGWLRVSVLGKQEKDIDLDIFSPISQKRALVQVKSTASISDIKRYRESWAEYEQYDEMYYIFHTFNGALNEYFNNDPRILLWDISKIASLVIETGLVQWLITKRS